MTGKVCVACDTDYTGPQPSYTHQRMWLISSSLSKDQTNVSIRYCLHSGGSWVLQIIPLGSFYTCANEQENEEHAICSGQPGQAQRQALVTM